MRIFLKTHRIGASKRLFAIMLLALFVTALLPVQDVWAGGAGGGGGSGESGNCPGNGFLERIVPCITKAMEKSTTKLANSLSTYLYPTAAIFVTLVIVIYGLKVMSPEGNPQKTAIPLLLKIAFVLMFVQNFGGFTPAVHGGMKEMVDILANALDVSSQCSSSGGEGGGGSSGGGGASSGGSGSGGGGGAAATGSDKIWTGMDCILGKLFGFTGKDGNTKLIASIFGLAAGFLFGGSFGLIAFFAIFGVLWSVLMFVFKSAFAFLNGFMLACFAVIISPLFIPLLLLQIPSQYFKNWYELLIGAFIMPLLVVGYCVFALSMYNKILFEGDRATAIRKTMEKTFSESITGMRTECLGTLINNVFFLSKGGSGGAGGAGGSGGNADGKFKSASIPNVTTPQQSGGQGLCIKVPNIDMQKLTNGFKNKQDFFRKIFTDGISLFLLAWLLGQGLQAIIELSSTLAGRGAGALMTPLSQAEQRIKAAMDNAKKKAQESMVKDDGSSYSGLEFMQRTPATLGAFVNGLR